MSTNLDVLALLGILLGAIAALGDSRASRAQDVVEKAQQSETAAEGEIASKPVEGTLAGTVWGGIYTRQQTLRGENAYLASCATCHNTTLRGSPGGPGIAGDHFTFKWANRSVGELLAYIQQTMPVGQGGSLPATTYADIVAYMLHVNGYPAGGGELPSNPSLLEGVLIIRSAD